MKQKHLNTLQVSESLYNMMNHSSRDKGSEYIWKIKIPPSTHQSLNGDRDAFLFLFHEHPLDDFSTNGLFNDK